MTTEEQARELLAAEFETILAGSEMAANLRSGAALHPGGIQSAAIRAIIAALSTPTERAQIVSWLRKDWPDAYLMRAFGRQFADAIEAGKHLSEPTSPSMEKPQ